MAKTDYIASAELAQLAARVIEENHEFDHLTGCQIFYQYSMRSKSSKGKIVYADCEKIKDKMKQLADYDFIITFYKEGALLDDEIKYRLMYHELLHVGYEPSDEDESKDKFSIVPHDLEDFKAVIEKWGVDWINGADLPESSADPEEVEDETEGEE